MMALRWLCSFSFHIMIALDFSDNMYFQNIPSGIAAFFQPADRQCAGTVHENKKKKKNFDRSSTFQILIKKS